MVKKKVQKKEKARVGGKTAPTKMRKPLGKDTPAAKWRRMAGLTGEALGALEAGSLEEVRQYLEAMRAVALCAAEGESVRGQRGRGSPAAP